MKLSMFKKNIGWRMKLAPPVCRLDKDGNALPEKTEETLLRSLGKAHMKSALYNLGRGNSGLLRLWTSVEVERLDPRTGETKTVRDAIPEDFGFLYGWSALGPNNHFVKAIHIELERLRHFDRGEGEAAQQWVSKDLK